MSLKQEENPGDALRGFFFIVTFSDWMPQNWLVIRKHDGKLMTQGSVYQCLRWVKVWGSTQGIAKRGMEVPEKILARLC